MTGEHYFTRRPAVASDRSTFQTVIKGRKYTFTTDAGVFSRGKLDPGTRLLIESVPFPKTGQILDLGCGYGPIGVVAAYHLEDGLVTMVDVNERAVELARENAALNEVKDKTEILSGDGFETLEGRVFDLIITNPPIRAGKKVIYPMVDEAFRHLSPQGSLYLVIRTKQGAGSMEKKLLETFGNVTTVSKGGGYRVFQAVRMA